MASHIGQSAELGLVAYGAVAALHMVSGYLSVQSVPLSTLNPSRLALLLDEFWAAQRGSAGSASSAEGPLCALGDGAGVKLT